MPPRHIDESFRVISKAFPLWKAKEAAEGRRIAMDTIIEEVGLAKMTVRKFMEPDADVGGSSLSVAAALAKYFGVPLGNVVEIQSTTTEAEPDSAKDAGQAA